MSVTRLLKKLRRLQPPDRRLVLEAAVALLLVRTALVLMPFGKLQRWLLSRRFTTGSPGGFPPDRIAAAVAGAASHVPGCRCLAQAIALQILLARHGHEAHLYMGVARAGAGLAAHAWVEHGGRVLIGAEDLSRYTRLPSFALGPPGGPS